MRVNSSTVQLPEGPKVNSPLSANRPARDVLAPPPAEALCKLLDWHEIKISWLAGDGSARCYYRITNPRRNKSMVLMQLPENDAKELKNGTYDWIAISEIFRNESIFAPSPIFAMADYNALIIEDYGNVMLETEIHELLEAKNFDQISLLYKQCIEIIAKLLAIPRNQNSVWCKRRFDADRFDWELNFFENKYIKNLPNFTLTDSEQKLFKAEAASLSSCLASFPQYFVHRDFHSRNIMIKDGSLALIDFQDARLGPATYDLVSLICDPYVNIPIAQRVHLLEEGCRAIGNIVSTGENEISSQLQACIIQRQLKAIGSYGYLTHDLGRDYSHYVIPALKIMLHPNFKSERWPFLSSILPQKLLDFEKAHVRNPSF